MNPLYSFSLEIEGILHYLLHCYHFNDIHVSLVNSAKFVIDNFESLSEKDKKDILLYGDPRLNRIKNKFILEATLTYIKNYEFKSTSYEFKSRSYEFKSTSYEFKFTSSRII